MSNPTAGYDSKKCVIYHIVIGSEMIPGYPGITDVRKISLVSQNLYRGQDGATGTFGNSVVKNPRTPCSWHRIFGQCCLS